MENNNLGRNSNNHQRNKQNLWNERKCPPQVNKQAHSSGQQSAVKSNGTQDSQKTYKTFRDLAIWQKGISLAKLIYEATNIFPKEELYGFVSQMRRAAVSIPSNIAEGYRRKHGKEFQQFLNAALGSMGELETQTILAGELNYLSAAHKTFLLDELDHLVRMTVSLCNKVQR